MKAKTCKRILCLLMLCAMAISFLVSCKKPPEETGSQDTTKTEETTGEFLNVPDVKYDNYEFVVLVTGNYANNDFQVVEDTVDVVNEAKYRKNSKVEEQFGIKITNVDKVSFGSTRGAGPGFMSLQQSYLAGTYDYDMGVIGAYDCATMAYNGYLTDFNTIPYINLENSWWDQNANTDLSIMGKLYFTAGDISLTAKMVTHCILFNKEIVKEYAGLRNPYELVKSNNWTFDTFGEEISKVSSDLNGNGTPDKDDQFGLMTFNDPTLAVISAAGERIVSVNNDGSMELTLYTQRTQTVLEKYCNIVFDALHAFNYQYGFPSAEWNTLRDNIFNSNRALYYMTTFVTVGRHRDMETDFGILPYPKLDATQEYYHTDTPFSTSFVVVPALMENKERTGAIIEALAYYSKEYMTPAYYDKTLTGRYFRDTESREMLDLIFATRMYDLGAYYNIASIGSELTAMLNSRQNTFSSLYARIEDAAKNQVKDINQKYSQILE